MRQAVKTLIFQADTGETVLVMPGGYQSAVSGLLKTAIGPRNIRMADPEVVWQPAGFRSFLKASLLEEPILGTGAASGAKESWSQRST